MTHALIKAVGNFDVSAHGRDKIGAGLALAQRVREKLKSVLESDSTNDLSEEDAVRQAVALYERFIEPIDLPVNDAVEKLVIDPAAKILLGFAVRVVYRLRHRDPAPTPNPEA